MLIEVDAQLFLDKEATGIAIYAGNMIRELWKCGHQIQYDIFEAKKIEQEVTNLKNSEHIEYSEMKKNIRICNKYSHRVYQWLSMFFPLRYSRLFGEDADVAIFFNYIVPPGVKAWKIAVIHDMSYLDCPKVVRWRTLFHLKYAMAASCRRADLILTVSEFSKRRIMKCLEVKEEKIEVVPCGIDFSCFCRKYAWKEIKQIKKKFGICGEYYLYVGTLEPRKNVERLFLAYGMLKKEMAVLPKLVLAGRNGWMYQRMFRLIKKLKLKDDIIFTGYVSEREKIILMQGTKVFVYPSLYEGFGMPVLEAMACGVPVLTSNCASMPEVIKDAGMLVEPYSVQSIKDGLMELEMNEHRRKRLAEKGYQRSKKFSWEASGRKLNEILLRNFETKERL